jgi:multimeric flavodoxin WrbA
MNIMLINGSPKPNGSASGAILNELRDYLPGHTISECAFHAASTLTPALADALAAQDVLVFAFPLYVDAIPSHLLRILVQLEDKWKNADVDQQVFAVVNAGFYEGRQCAYALRMIKSWCETCRLRYGRGVGIGAGGMLPGLANVPAGRGPRRNFTIALKELAQSIDCRTGGEDIFVVPNFPRFLYIKFAHMGWRMQARQNGIRPKQLGVRRPLS